MFSISWVWVLCLCGCRFSVDTQRYRQIFAPVRANALDPIFIENILCPPIIRLATESGYITCFLCAEQPRKLPPSNRFAYCGLWEGAKELLCPVCHLQCDSWWRCTIAWIVSTYIICAYMQCEGDDVKKLLQLVSLKFFLFPEFDHRTTLLIFNLNFNCWAFGILNTVLIIF